jgi:hypothetical protein
MVATLIFAGPHYSAEMEYTSALISTELGIEKKVVEIAGREARNTHISIQYRLKT